MTNSWAVLVGLISLVALGASQSHDDLSITSVDITSMASDLPATSLGTVVMPTVTTTTTSSAPTTSSMSPTPTPAPISNNNFLLKKEGSNDTCAHVVATMVLDITYTNVSTAAKGSRVSRTIHINDFHPGVQPAASSCKDSEIKMGITFFKNMTFRHGIIFEFNKKGKNDYKLSMISVDLDITDPDLFPDFNTTEVQDEFLMGNTSSVFSASEKKSYKCNSRRKFKITTDPDLGKGNSLDLKLSDFRAQAFEFKDPSSGAFDDDERCSLDQKSSKVVPIAVGAALAGLVVVVLIAYLIGRFRSRKQNSYEALS